MKQAVHYFYVFDNETYNNGQLWDEVGRDVMNYQY